MQRGVQKIFITGFSGAGKSTLLQELKQLAGAREALKDWSFIDADAWLLERFGKPSETMGEFIGRIGFSKFRELESQEVLHFTELSENTIIALGAGALSPANRQILEASTILHLALDFETCWQRISNDPNRPLVKLGKEGMKEVFRERLPIYEAYPAVANSSDIIDFIKKSV